MLTVCRFKNDAPFAYSITYDEGFIDVLANAYPIHKKLDIPGHLDVVAGQLGRRRDCFGSSLNGIFHMDAEHLRFLISEGWSVGNHSYSHFSYPHHPGLDMYREVVYSKYYLEDQIGIPVTHFAVPNDKFNYMPALPYIKQAGYLSCQHIEGGVNYDDVDLLKIGNFMVASGKIRPRTGWPEKLLTKNIDLKAVKDGWLCETTHLVQPYPVQDWKNISADDLKKRFEKMLEISKGKVWAATPNEVVDYILLRRNTKVKKLKENEYFLDVNFPVGVNKRMLSLKAEDREEKIKKVLVNNIQTSFTREGRGIVFRVDDVFKRNDKTHIKLETEKGE